MQLAEDWGNGWAYAYAPAPGEWDKAEQARDEWTEHRASEAAPLTLLEFIKTIAPASVWPSLEGRPESELIEVMRFYMDARELDTSEAEQDAVAAGKVLAEVLVDDDADDDTIKGAAKGCALAAVGLVRVLPADDLASVFGQVWPVAFPQVGKRGVTLESLARRLCDSRSWVRQIRREHARSVARRLTAEGRVMRGREAYLPGLSLSKKKAQWARNREAIEAAKILSACGESYDLAKAVEASIANPRNKLAELIIRARGMEAAAEEAGHAAAFLTVTTPSKYHPSRTRYEKQASGRRYFSEANPKWHAAGQPDPKEANGVLGRVFAHVRYAAKNERWGVYGLRTVEPHADGCPHWHMLVFGPRAELEAYVAEFERQACKEDAAELAGEVSALDEAGKWRRVPAKRARFTAKWLDRVQIDGEGKRQGGPLAYLLKYLTKNVTGRNLSDGAEIGQDFETKGGAAEGAERVRAWASLWGNRQFQTFGDARVGIWRECRRLRDDAPEDERLLAAVWAATVNDWQSFREIEPALDLFKVAGQANRFGEDGRELVKGVCTFAAVAVTRTKEWAIDWRAAGRAMAAELAESETREWNYYHARHEVKPGGGLVWFSEGQRPELGFISITVRSTERESDARPETTQYGRKDGRRDDRYARQSAGTANRAGHKGAGLPH